MPLPTGAKFQCRCSSQASLIMIINMSMIVIMNSCMIMFNMTVVTISTNSNVNNVYTN